MPCPSMGPKLFRVENYLVKYQIGLGGTNLFWSGSNNFGQVQIIKISPEKSNLNLTKIIWTRPKRFGPNQNIFFPIKTIWTVQNNFWPIKGQGSTLLNVDVHPSNPNDLIIPRLS